MGLIIKSITTHYFDFKGRARRAELWFFLLFVIITSLALNFIDVGLGTYFTGGPPTADGEPSGVGGLFSGLFGVLMIIPFLSLVVRRFHDLGRSGWWILIILLLPYVNLIVLIILGFLGGQESDNQWGSPPEDNDKPRRKRKHIGSRPGDLRK